MYTQIPEPRNNLHASGSETPAYMGLSDPGLLDYIRRFAGIRDTPKSELSRLRIWASNRDDSADDAGEDEEGNDDEEAVNGDDDDVAGGDGYGDSLHQQHGHYTTTIILSVSVSMVTTTSSPTAVVIKKECSTSKMRRLLWQCAAVLHADTYNIWARLTNGYNKEIHSR